MAKEVFPEANKELAQYLFKLGSSFYNQNKCAEALESLHQALRAANPDVDKIIVDCENSNKGSLKNSFLHIKSECAEAGYDDIMDCYNSVGENTQTAGQGTEEFSTGAFEEI